MRACRWPPLAAPLTREGRLPPAGLPADRRIDNQRRGVELPLSPRFSGLAVRENSLPLVHGYARSATARIGPVVAGQKLPRSGGDVRRSQACRSALARAQPVRLPTGGPHRDGRGTGFIGEQLRQGEVSAAGLGLRWKLANAEPIIFAREPGATGATPHNTADDFWSG